jgi:hypothetical protein
MAKIEYSAECLCGGKILTTFKKPTRMQHSISKVRCQGCQSEFMFSFHVEYNEGARAYVPSHEVVNMTDKLKSVVKEKKRERELSA